jgi:hypothetical protein
VCTCSDEWSTLTLDLEFYVDGRIRWVFTLDECGVKSSELLRLIRPFVTGSCLVHLQGDTVDQVRMCCVWVHQARNGLGFRLAQILERWSDTVERTTAQVIRINNHQRLSNTEPIYAALFHCRGEEEDEDGEYV